MKKRKLNSFPTRIHHLADKRQRAYAKQIIKPIIAKHQQWINYGSGGSKDTDKDWKSGPPPSFYSLSTTAQKTDDDDVLAFLDQPARSEYDYGNNGQDNTVGYGTTTDELDVGPPTNLNNDDTNGQITYGQVGTPLANYTYAANNNDVYTTSGKWDADLFKSADSAEEGYYRAAGMGDYYDAQQADTRSDFDKLQDGKNAYLQQQSAIVTRQAQDAFYNTLLNTSVYNDAPPALRQQLLSLVAYKGDGGAAQTMYMNAKWGGDPSAVGLAYEWGFESSDYGAKIANTGTKIIDEYRDEVMNQIKSQNLGQVINGVYISPDQQAAVLAARQNQNDKNNMYAFGQYIDNYRNNGDAADPNDLVNAYQTIKSVTGGGDIANTLKGVLGQVAQSGDIDTTDDNSFFNGDGLDSDSRAALLLGNDNNDLRDKINGSLNDEVQVSNLKTELYRLQLADNQQTDPQEEAKKIVSDINDAASTYSQYRQMLGEVKAYLSSKNGTLSRIGDALPNLPLLSFDDKWNLNLDTGYTSLIQQKYNKLVADSKATYTDGGDASRLWKVEQNTRDANLQDFLNSGKTSGDPRLLNQAADTSALVKDGLTDIDQPLYARSFEYQQRYANFTDAALQAKIAKNNTILQQNAITKAGNQYANFADDALDWTADASKQSLIPKAISTSADDLRLGSWGTSTGKPILNGIADSLGSIGSKIQAAVTAFNGTKLGATIQSTLNGIQTGWEATGLPAAERAFSSALNAPVLAASQGAISAIKGSSLAARAAADTTLGARAAGIAVKAAVTATKVLTFLAEGVTTAITTFFGPAGLLLGGFIGTLALLGQTISRAFEKTIRNNFTGQWYHAGDDPNRTQNQNADAYLGAGLANAWNPLSVIPALETKMSDVKVNAPGRGFNDLF